MCAGDSVRGHGCRAAIVAGLLSASASAQFTQHVSVGSTGAPGNGRSTWCAISADGRWVAFKSGASDLVPGDTNGVADVFVRDRRLGTSERVSVASDGTQADGPPSEFVSISADGRFVGFDTWASNLVAGDTNGVIDVYVHDRATGGTERVSIASDGTPGNGYSLAPALSADGRFVAFYSDSINLVLGDSNGWGDVFVRDRLAGTTERVTVSSTGVQANFTSGHHGPSISADGRFVTFSSLATNLAFGVPHRHVYIRDRALGTTERASISSGGVPANGETSAPTISDDGRFVAFMSDATNLVAGDTNGVTDVFVRDRQTGTTVRASLDPLGAEGDGASTFPSISGDGHTVAFASLATNLVPGDANGREDVFVHDLAIGATERASVGSDGAEANGDSRYPATSRNGRCVAFESLSGDLTPGVPVGARIYLRDRADAPIFVLACEPGAGGVIACPCGNAPGSAGRGCDNSSASGGATLVAEGGTFLSSDSLVFHANDAVPDALGLLLQGDASLPAGVVFGQGVRCAGGQLVRLYGKTTSGGSMEAPEFAAGDPTVSQRSAELGDPIPSGSSRWYFVYYRDTIVLGACPPVATFNATPMARIVWSP